MYKFEKFYLFFLASLKIISLVQASTVNDPTYKVAVVEFSRSVDKDENLKLEENLLNAAVLFRNNLSPGTFGENVDIVVFPESVLNNYATPVEIPNPNLKEILCDPSAQKPELLNKLSCWAGNFHKYMAFNIVEKINCTAEGQKQQNDNRSCGRDGLTRYNTNIVFDRKGALISRYRKVNPYNEYLINTTVQPDYTTFETDFGVKFGVSICFDLLFKTPAQELVEIHGITDMIYSTYWFSELPFLTANQIQHSWSYANNVNFLASGGNRPETGTTGTGIYVGSFGALVSRMYGHTVNDLIIADVPKKGFANQGRINYQDQTIQRVNALPNRLKGLKVKRETTVSSFTSKKIEKAGNIEENLCHKDICCEFKLEVKTFDKRDGYEFYHFRMVAYSGIRNYGDGFRTGHYKTCAVIACTNDSSLESCGEVYEDNVRVQNYYYFNKMEINGKTNDFNEVLFMPTSVDQSLKPLPVREFEFNTTEKGSSKSITMKLNYDNSDLLTFGIYGINYKSSAIKPHASSIFIISLISLVLYFCKNLF